PFAAGSFDAVLSFAVFEHLHNPFLAIREVSRILKPGGVFVGVVSQGEPFHESYFHHTAWGVIALAASTGELDVVQMWPSRDTLLALARMSRYSKVVKLSLRMLDVFNRNTPFLTPRKMRWPAKLRAIDEVNRAGSIGFVMKRR
ncbi:MAG: class I SAM-dependent methyltransferase, partial [Planctomycetaceae bacterium]|nr:class I SAM-dependent methyltransferase [Planctomycetaceae bacterium]